MAAVEEDYVDVLQNIEFCLVNPKSVCTTLYDHDLLQIVELAIAHYRAAQRQLPPPTSTAFNETQQGIFERLIDVCNQRLGYPSEHLKPIPESAIIAIDELLLCLKRIEKSINCWTKNYGRRGYIEFVSQYV